MIQLNLKIKAKKIGWLFHYDNILPLELSCILPWSLKDYSFLPEEAPVDFLVYVYPIGLPASDSLAESFLDFRGTKFILAGEAGHRFRPIDNCYSIVSGARPDDHSSCRYGPLLGSWCPPLVLEGKTKKCSVIESGKYAWRIDLIQDLIKKVDGVDVYGPASGYKLGGYHSIDSKSVFGNAKYRGLKDYGFYLSLENCEVEDYWTEKIGDAILCESVPVYFGCPNILDYFIPESFVAYSEASSVDWPNWSTDYERRRKYVLMQKEVIRTKFTMWSYFNLLTDDLSLLDKKRPIVR